MPKGSDPTVVRRLLPPLTSLVGTIPDTLSKVDSDLLPDGALVWVMSEQDFYVFRRSSSATADSVNIIQSFKGSKPLSGRWFRLSFLFGSPSSQRIWEHSYDVFNVVAQETFTQVMPYMLAGPSTWRAFVVIDNPFGTGETLAIQGNDSATGVNIIPIFVISATTPDATVIEIPVNQGIVPDTGLGSMTILADYAPGTPTANAAAIYITGQGSGPVPGNLFG